MTAHPLMQRVLERGSLPSLSPVAIRLMEMAADDSAGAKAMAQVIEMDPGLSARLLSLVNSTAYRRGSQEVTSLDRALSLAGAHEVRFMALSMSLARTLPSRAGGPDYHLFWRASLHRALLARLLARQLRLASPEEAFALALTLEMGLPLLLQVMTGEELAGFPGFHVSLEAQMAWEEERHGLDHRQVGRAVMEAWHLPALFAQAQGYLGQDDPQAPPALKVVDLARRGAESFFAPGIELTDIHQMAQARFALEAGQVNRLLLDSLTTVGQVAQAMEVKLDQQADLLEVMTKAQATLDSLKTRVAPGLRALLQVEESRRPAQKHAFLEQIGALVADVGGLAHQVAGLPGQAEPLTRQAKAVMEEAARVDKILDEIDDFTEF